jgi:O-methyltransferase involved in polyketide biosynthesis
VKQGVYKVTNSETPSLTGVPETMLWPLWNRAVEARRNNPLLKDPLSAGLVARIDYDFEAMFGKPNVAHAIRASYCDTLVRSFMECHPEGSVVSLGEGLDTQFWRVDNGNVAWFSVDVPESIEVRQRLLPEHKRNTCISVSALDPSWMDQIPAEKPVFICAAGLFMYFERQQVVQLLGQISENFIRAELFFDTIPPIFSRKTMKGYHVTKSYVAPPMPFGIGLADIEKFAAEIPRFKLLSALTYADPYPDKMKFVKFISRIDFLRNNFAPALIHAEICG